MSDTSNTPEEELLECVREPFDRDKALTLYAEIKWLQKQRDEFEREYQRVFALLVKAEETIRHLSNPYDL